MKTLDSIDQKMLALLKDNARLPLVAIAKVVGLSRSATQERLSRLEKTAVIEKYTVRINSGPETGFLIGAWLSVKLLPGFSCDDVMPYLIPMPEIVLCQSVTGEVDLLIHVQVASPELLGSVRETILALKGVESISTQTVLRTQLDRR
jgi:Lrp/AsnC family transcriptional regulator, leucine-responsive regulatory protein